MGCVSFATLLPFLLVLASLRLGFRVFHTYVQHTSQPCIQFEQLSPVEFNKLACPHFDMNVPKTCTHACTHTHTNARARACTRSWSCVLCTQEFDIEALRAAWSHVQDQGEPLAPLFICFECASGFPMLPH